MSARLQIIRNGHIIGEYDDLKNLKTIVALLDDPKKIVEFIGAILVALTLYQSEVKSGAFRIGSFRVKFQGGDDL